jgi:hypothetical protein
VDVKWQEGYEKWKGDRGWGVGTKVFVIYGGFYEGIRKGL